MHPGRRPEARPRGAHRRRVELDPVQLMGPDAGGEGRVGGHERPAPRDHRRLQPAQLAQGDAEEVAAPAGRVQHVHAGEARGQRLEGAGVPGAPRGGVLELVEQQRPEDPGDGRLPGVMRAERPAGRGRLEGSGRRGHGAGR